MNTHVSEMTPKDRVRITAEVYQALRDGVLIRPGRCSKCKKECTPDGHHEDYRKPLKVVWLCQQCHAARHTKVLGRNIVRRDHYPRGRRPDETACIDEMLRRLIVTSVEPEEAA